MKERRLAEKDGSSSMLSIILSCHVTNTSAFTMITRSHPKYSLGSCPGMFGAAQARFVPERMTCANDGPETGEIYIEFKFAFRVTWHAVPMLVSEFLTMIVEQRAKSISDDPYSTDVGLLHPRWPALKSHLRHRSARMSRQHVSVAGDSCEYCPLEMKA